MLKKILLVGVVLALGWLLISCTPFSIGSDQVVPKVGADKATTITKEVDKAITVTKEVNKSATTETVDLTSKTSKADWKQAELTDTLTGKKFKISDYKGKVVLVQSFAVWCPNCLKQSREIAKVAGVTKVSLDTDPNEDVVKVKEHATKHGFDWNFVVSPKEVTKLLIDQFGFSVVNAPSEPVILVCKDQSTRFLKRGLKTTTELQEEIKKGC